MITDTDGNTYGPQSNLLKGEQNTVNVKDFFNKVIEDFAKTQHEIAKKEYSLDDR